MHIQAALAHLVVIGSAIAPPGQNLETLYSSLNLRQNPCLAEYYYGTFGTYSIVIPSEQCWSTTSNLENVLAHHRIEVPPSLCWAQLSGDRTGHTGQETQRPFGAAVADIPVLYSDPLGSAALFVCDDQLRISAAFWQFTSLPHLPIPLTCVPPEAVQRVGNILENLTYDSVVSSIVESISLAQMEQDIRFLTGEDPSSPVVSRHSFTEGALFISEWISGIVEKTGATCQRAFFLDGFAPNIICDYPSLSDSNETIVIGAHYDSRGTFGSIRAPGADDDGSGTTSLLSIARAIGTSHVFFKNSVQLAFFAGEEQGLLGSKAHAKKLKDENTDIVLMVQSDMLGYHVPSEPAQLGLQKVIGTPEVAQLVGNVSLMYSPELTVGYSSACCSDHQSFHEQGFPATEVSERGGPIADPMYHSSGDVSNRPGFDLAQVRSIAKATFATVLHAAGYERNDKGS